MNVILIVADTFRYDYIGANGNPWIKTPSLDRLASESAVFDRAYTASFPTIPNRTDLMTGRYGEPLHPWAPLSWDALTLPEILAGHGYVTMLIHDTPHLVNYGFGFDRPFHGWEFIRGNEVDRWRTGPARSIKLPTSPGKWRFPETFYAQYLRNVAGRQHERDYFAPRVMRAAMNWLEENRDHDRFFLWIDSFDPHEPWDPPRHYVEMYDPEYDGPEVTYPRHGPDDFLTPEERKHCKALYAAEVTMVDRWVGLLLDHLAAIGLADDTLVIFTADHGAAVGDHGQQWKSAPLYEEIARIPLMIRHPQGVGKGMRTAALVQPPDLMPTILSALGLEVPREVQGRSLWPLITAERDRVRDLAVAGPSPLPRAPGLPPVPSPLSVTDGEWSLIAGPDRSRWQLYDLRHDPGQLRNVVAAQPEVATRLFEGLLSFLEEHEAPPEVVAMYREGVEPPPVDPASLSAALQARLRRGLSPSGYIHTPVQQ